MLMNVMITLAAAPCTHTATTRRPAVTAVSVTLAMKETDSTVPVRSFCLSLAPTASCTGGKVQKPQGYNVTVDINRETLDKIEKENFYIIM